ncbi:MAG: hypothetical protein HYY17_02430 [Planctomycetes bacterium]|nr:hypothetical protein [Planctomycetota bacterium]
MNRAWMSIPLSALVVLGGWAPPQDRKTALGFENLDGENLAEVTILVQKATGCRFMWSDDVQLGLRRIYFRSGRPVTDKDEIFRLYQSFLQQNGLFLVPAEGTGGSEPTYRIHPAMTMNKCAVPVAREAGRPQGRVVTRVFLLHRVAARDAHAALINMVTFPNAIMVVESGKALLVTDYDDNMKRIETVLEAVDRPADTAQARIYPLRERPAKEVEAVLTRLASGVKGLRSVAADERTNSLIVVAEDGAFKLLDELVRLLDAKK